MAYSYVGEIKSSYSNGNLKNGEMTFQYDPKYRYRIKVSTSPTNLGAQSFVIYTPSYVPLQNILDKTHGTIVDLLNTALGPTIKTLILQHTGGALPYGDATVTAVLERELINTAPTTPGPFVQPTGILEIGDSKTISWGASTDAESDLAYYVLEVSINNGAWTQIGIPTINNFTYTIPPIPTATKIQFRVKARDTTGLESAFRESSIFTVQPPQYYWSKYNAVPNLLYNDDAPWGSKSTESVLLTGTAGRSYTFDRYNNKYTVTSPYGSGTPLNLGDIAYGVTTDGQYLRKHQVVEMGRTTDNFVLVNIEIRDRSANTKTINSYSRGTLVQSNIMAGADAYINDARNNDGFWYVRGSRVSESIAPPQGITSPAPDTVFRPGNIVNIAFTASTAANISAYEVDYRYNNDVWTPLATNATLTRSLTATTDSTKTTLEFRIRAKNTSNVYSDYIYSPLYTIQHNVAPVVTLDTENNKTLYENDSFKILGAVQDTDKDNTVTVRYQISGGTERAIKAYLSNGSQELYSKTLTFKGGSLYDGETLIVGDLVDGTLYTLRVWATDDKGGTSAIAERTFYVVPNRAPQLTVNTPIVNGNVESDKITIDGEFADPDNNTTVVTYRINGGSSVQVAEGTSGNFEFELTFGQLKVGENVIVVEALDSYGAKVSKTLKLNKTIAETPLLKSTARYKINPPAGNAKAVLLWIQRDEGLIIDVAINMNMANEVESFVALTPTNTAPLGVGSTMVEDEFYYETDAAKENIIIQIDLTRESVEVNDAITLISGVLE